MSGGDNFQVSAFILWTGGDGTVSKTLRLQI